MLIGDMKNLTHLSAKPKAAGPLLAILFVFLASHAHASAMPATCAPAKTAPGPYPSFCEIPAVPTDIRGPEAFKAAVVETRQAGRRVVVQSAPETFALPLGAGDAFAGDARAEAAPPPPETAATEDIDRFAAAARKQASPPARPRR